MKGSDVDRFWEIDILRAIAVIMMITFHLIFDLYFFSDYDFDVDQGFWLFLARSTAIIFIFLVGVSLTLSYSKRKRREESKLFLRYLKRGLKIFSYGLLISLITWIFVRDGFIIFGILHFIGISIILAYPFIEYKIPNLVLGVVIILIGSFILNFQVNYPWLLWIGIKPEIFYTVDYFPILPWFGLVLIGIFFGNTFYPNHKRSFNVPDISDNLLIRFFCFIGRNTLKIYFLHQPLIILILYLLGIIDINILI